MTPTVQHFIERLLVANWPIPAANFAISWFVMLIAGRGLIAWLKRLKGMKWSPREDTPDSHLAKAGTPSMGGIGIIGLASLVFSGLICVLAIWTAFGTPLGTTGLADALLKLSPFPAAVVLHCLLGFADDWSKARGKGGLLARQKLVGQIGIAAIFLGLCWWFRFSAPIPRTNVQWPFADSIVRGGGLIGVITGTVALLLVIIGTSNAVNLTDGIDGLAAGLSVQCGFAYVLFGVTSKWPDNFSTHPDVSWFWAALAGTCLGFLAYNKNPAKVFMGDTGSLALGAALGCGAVLTSTVALLPFIGFIFFVEMFSVIAQVAYFKYTKKKYGEGRRIFRRAPLHHHFELGGWSEWRVVGTFWLVNLCTTVLGLALWYAKILPRFP